MEEKYTSDQTLGKTEEARYLTALAAFVSAKFEENVRFRQQNGVDDILLECKYAAAGEYTPEDLKKRRDKGVPCVYAPLSDTKRRAAMAWMSEIFLNNVDKPYEIRPTPIPDMPEQIVQEIAGGVIQEWYSVVSPNPPQTPEELEAVRAIAEQRRDELENLVKEEADKRARRLDKIVQDRLAEGRWREAMTVAFEHLATYGTAVMKITNRIRNRMVRSVNKYGLSKFSVKPEARLEFQAIDPFDCYPSKGARSIEDGYFCQRVRFLPHDLSLMRGNKNYFDDALTELVMKYSGFGHRTVQTVDYEQDKLNNDGSTMEPTSTIEGIEFWGTVLGDLLLRQGMMEQPDGKKIEADAFYEVNCIVIDGLVVYCDITDPRLGRPLFKGMFYNVPGSWWGHSPIWKMRDIQKIANGSISSMVWNMGMSSGPQVAITDIERLNTKDLGQEPWKVWVFDKPRMGSSTSDVPIKFFQPNSNSTELMQIYDRMAREADTMTGIPAYAYGSDVAAGAGRTAAGLSIMIDASNRGMKYCSYSVDNHMCRPMMTYVVNLEMLNSDDEGIKGDVTIDPGGILGVLSTDKTSNQLKEVLALCQNPLVANAIGEEGITELLRKLINMIPNINPDRIIPTREELEYRRIKAQLEQLRMMQMQQAIQQQGQIAGQQAQKAAGLPVQGAPAGASAPQGAPRQVPMMDGVANVAAMGGQLPGSTFNQYQPNRPPVADAEVMA